MSASKRTNKAGGNRSSDEEYQNKRHRNNEAVKRSREKTRQQAQETRDQLKRVQENADRLEMKVELRRIELQNYKDLFNETLKKLKNSGREIDVDAIFKLDDDPGSRQ